MIKIIENLLFEFLDCFSNVKEGNIFALLYNFKEKSLREEEKDLNCFSI